MPTYTYCCPVCGMRFELFHSIMDSGEKLCPNCEVPAQRQMGGGSGFSMGGGASSGLSSIPAPPRGGFT